MSNPDRATRRIDAAIRQTARLANEPGRTGWRALKSKLGSEEANSMVEFALASVVLCSLVLGVIEMSFALYSFHMIADLAREGSRYAMVHGNSCVASGSSCKATTAEIQTYVQNLNYPGITPSHVAVTTTYASYPTAGVSCTPNADCTDPGDLVTVKVTYSFPLAIPFVETKSLSMQSSSSVVISQ